MDPTAYLHRTKTPLIVYTIIKQSRFCLRSSKHNYPSIHRKYLIDAFKWSHSIFTNFVLRTSIWICQTFININTGSRWSWFKAWLAVNTVTSSYESLNILLDVIHFDILNWILLLYTCKVIDWAIFYLPSSSFNIFPYPQRNFSHLKDPLVFLHLYKGPKVSQLWLPSL